MMKDKLQKAADSKLIPLTVHLSKYYTLYTNQMILEYGSICVSWTST